MLWRTCFPLIDTFVCILSGSLAVGVSVCAKTCVVSVHSIHPTRPPTFAVPYTYSARAQTLPHPTSNNNNNGERGIYVYLTAETARHEDEKIICASASHSRDAPLSSFRFAPTMRASASISLSYLAHFQTVTSRADAHFSRPHGCARLR